MKGDHYFLEKSAVYTVIGIILLFSTAVIVTLIAPRYVDSSWTTPTNPYQVQMYEVADPNLYMSVGSGRERQLVYHLKRDYTLLAFQEQELVRFVSQPELEKYITKFDSPVLLLTSQLFLLREPKGDTEMGKLAKEKKEQLEKQWGEEHKEEKIKPSFEVLEIYAVEGDEAFALASTDGVLENWVDHEYKILDESPKNPYHKDPGVIYVSNPQEYRVSQYRVGQQKNWRYDPNGEKIANLDQLKSHPMGFLSRKELIYTGEKIFAIEGCWYCHSDQTRTLVQDLVLNGSDSYPAPPSSANEYVFQEITFLSTRRIGPDLSRVGVKRPNRDWHKAHFWSPKTASVGSIMPSFRHFFDDDPRGIGEKSILFPNYQFEAIFQYLMTKGTRITPPTQAWWLGKDPIKTKEIIEGRKVIK